MEALAASTSIATSSPSSEDRKYNSDLIAQRKDFAATSIAYNTALVFYDTLTRKASNVDDCGLDNEDTRVSKKPELN